MLSQTQLNVLASFFPSLMEKTSKEIETSTCLSHESVFRTLKSLVKTKHLKKRKVGKTNVYEFILTDDSYFTYAYFATKRISKFKEKHQLLYKRLREFADYTGASSIILFGSYAKGTEGDESDIDILVVSDENNIEKTASVFKTKYNLSMNAVVINPKNFKNIKADNPIFYNDLLEFGVIFLGIEFFFREVYQNAKVN